ncbi:sigma-70 family RNA polymerase sigma factor [Vibrio barjaei]|uniref:sigma-70 family RNA polymerase sigma factor n=1 Tax=Vibrio barjaei TaxID=1676683 RepID=UPI0022835F1E|nr:sigma-70 family RNA polymerase sigma factor [Vibrio barjaei]MCY9874534.1 sigma-70 family RNA polymerase sigma factor [Vibrio barjaei]
MSELLESIKAAREGSVRSTNKIITEMTPMARRIASKYKVKESQDNDDLIQEGLMAAHKAIHKFNLDYGETFIDERFYAYVRKAMEHAVICYLQQFDVVPVPRRLWQIRNMIELENPTDVEEFCEKHNISESRFYDAKALIVGMESRPRNVDVDTVNAESLFDDGSLEDSIFINKIRKVIDEHLHEYAQFFDDNELAIFKSIYFGQKTAQEVGEEFEMCPSRVRYVTGQALKNLRELLMDDGLSKDDVL